MFSKEANFKRKMAELKGVSDLVSEELAPTPSQVELENMRKQLEQKTKSNPQVQKTANVGSTTIDVFQNVVFLIKNKFGLEGDEARELANVIINKSLGIKDRFGIPLLEAVDKVIDAMSDKYQKSGELEGAQIHSTIIKAKGSFNDPSELQQHVFDHFEVNYTQAGQYARIAFKVANDLSIKFSKHALADIAQAVVGVAIKSGDINVLNDIKKSEVLQDALRLELEGYGTK